MASTSEIPSVLIMGATCVDRILSVTAYPSPDSKIRTTTNNVDMCGGNAANVAAALALLSSSTYARHVGELGPSSSATAATEDLTAAVRVVLLTKVGDDDAAIHLKADLESKGIDGIDCSSRLFVMQPNSTTSITTVIASETEHTRTCLHSPGTCGELTVEEVEDALSPSEGGDELFRNVILFHSDTRHTDAAVALAKEARRRGIPISVDVEKDRGPMMDELVAKASIVFGNEDKLQEYATRRLMNDEGCSSRPLFSYAPDAATDAEGLGRNEEYIHRIASLLRHGGNAIQRDKSVVVTRGSKGAYHIKQQKTAPFSTDSSRCNVHSVGTLRDATIVDTTGAGDAFIAGYTMGLVAQNLPFNRCISFFQKHDTDSDCTGDDNANGGNNGECNLTMFRLRFASWVTGRKLGGPGAQSALPSAKNVDECLGITYADVQRKLEVLVG